MENKNMFKSIVKQNAVNLVDTKMDSDIAPRIENIVRSCANHLSYNLRCGKLGNNVTSIYLEKGDKIIIIERNPDVYKGYWRINSIGRTYKAYEFAFEKANEIMNKVKADLETQTLEKKAETNEQTICAN